MTRDPLAGFRAALAERLSDPDLSGDDVLIIADKRGAEISNRFAGPRIEANTSTVQVVQAPPTVAAIQDLLSRMTAIAPSPPPAWLGHGLEIEPKPLPARLGWELMQFA